MPLISQWLFLVPLKSGRWHIIPQLAVYTAYSPCRTWGMDYATGIPPFFWEPVQQPLTVPNPLNLVPSTLEHAGK